MTREQVKATGNFLSTYYTDLIYIRDFQRFKEDKISPTEYLKKSNGTFYQFLIEFRVMRNVSKERVAELLAETKNWTRGLDSTHVDKFAKHIMSQGITHGKVMTSLASKILFLNDPWTIFPFDNLAKKSLKQMTNNYSDYLPRIEKFKKENEDYTITSFQIIDIYLKRIEKEFRDELKNIELIRLNRFTDKLLWTGVKINE